MKRIRNSIALWMCICVGMGIKAQSFGHRATIELVSKTGFYGISISPELSGYLNVDFSDLRILDDKGNFVPFVVKNDLPKANTISYQQLAIISNENVDSGRTVLIVENHGKEKIADFLIRIKNASVSRTIDLSGSDDKMHWFSIDENISLVRMVSEEDDNYPLNLEFPLSSYRYFKLTIYNGKNNPLNIISVSKYLGDKPIEKRKFIDNPSLKFVQKDSIGHASTITVFNPNLYHISHVQMKMHGPPFFKREVLMMAAGQTLYEGNINSDSVFQYDIPVFKDSVWSIKIMNGDNPPLKMDSITTGQDIQKIVSYLEADKNYTLELTNRQASYPQYDLQNFSDSIGYQVPELNIGKIETNAKENSKLIEKPLLHTYWIWIVIGLVLLVLVYFTWKLTTEVGKR